MLGEIVEAFSDEELIRFDGFDGAVIGIEENSMKLVYSVSKCISILEEDMSTEDAEEYFSFNVQGSYIGDRTPIFVNDRF